MVDFSNFCLCQRKGVVLSSSSLVGSAVLTNSYGPSASCAWKKWFLLLLFWLEAQSWQILMVLQPVVLERRDQLLPLYHRHCHLAYSTFWTRTERSLHVGLPFRRLTKLFGCSIGSDWALMDKSVNHRGWFSWFFTSKSLGSIALLLFLVNLIRSFAGMSLCTCTTVWATWFSLMKPFVELI